MILQTHDHGPQHARICQAHEPSDLRPDKPFWSTDDPLRSAVHQYAHIQKYLQEVTALTMTGLRRGCM